MKYLLFAIVLLSGCGGTAVGNGKCNNNSVTECKGVWVGTECGPGGRGYTCTEVPGGGILTPQCSCQNGQGNPPPAILDRAGRVMIDSEGNSIPIEER
jgi:hypothetical protein